MGEEIRNDVVETIVNGTNGLSSEAVGIGLGIAVVGYGIGRLIEAGVKKTIKFVKNRKEKSSETAVTVVEPAVVEEEPENDDFSEV